MLSFPLIVRELRVQSRKRATYHARLGWGLGAVLVLGFLVWGYPGQAAHGRFIFAALHLCIGTMLFFLAPLGAADAISREKREGTLSLLRLTSLTPFQIVNGKLAAHLIRLFYFGLMMLPFLLLPMLLGGVAVQDFLLSFLILLTLVLSGIAGGLIASALHLNFGAALASSLILSTVLAWLASTAVTNGLFAILPLAPRFFELSFVARLIMGPGLIGFPLQAAEIAGILFTSRQHITVIQTTILLLPLLFATFAIIFAARKVAQYADFVGETPHQAAFRRRFLTPMFWRERFRQSLGRKLDRNPFIWLEYRSAWARSAHWIMVLLVLSAETLLVMTLPYRDEFIGAHFLMFSILLAFVTLKSCGSFQREKESGAFELLVVSPLTERDIVFGRLRAVATYYALPFLFLMIIGLLGFTWTQNSNWNFSEQNHLSPAAYFTTLLSALFSAPFCGLFFALRCRSFIPALAWTAGLAVFAPAALWAAFYGLLWLAAGRWNWKSANLLRESIHEVWWPVLLAILLYHFLAALLVSRATIKRLRDRQISSPPPP